MHVAFLAARTVPNDCGTWVAVRSMVESLIRHGTLEYTFEINDSQIDIAHRHSGNPRVRFIPNLRTQIPRTFWIDGHHPRFRSLDAGRDWVYQKLLGGWSLSKSSFARQAKRTGAGLVHYPFQDLPLWHHCKGLNYSQMAYDFRQEHLPKLETNQSLNRLRSQYDTYRHASALCVLGKSCKEDAMRFAHVEPDRIFVTPFGPWEVSPPASAEFREKLREQFGLPDAFVFYPAPTRVHKNHARLVRALAALKKKGMRVPLVTTGKQPPYYEELMAIIRESGMHQDVIFTDYVNLETLYALYDLATVVVLPTLFEGATGIPLLEAMSKGKPIAAARVCEIPTGLGDSGLMFDPYSESEIASAVEQLWESPSLREQFSAMARQADQRRSWKAFAETTEKAFKYAHDHPAT